MTTKLPNSHATVYDPKRISSDIVMVDSKKAQALRDACDFEGHQRDINELNVDRLASEQEAGRFVPGTAITFCVLPNKEMILVNGNHTLEAITKSGQTIPLTFIYIQVPDREAAGMIYARFDIHKGRTWRDAARAVGVGEVPYIDKAVSAVGFILSGFRNDSQNVLARFSRDARFNMLHEYDKALAVISPILDNAIPAIRRCLVRQPVLAVAMYTMRYRSDAATSFWTGIASDDGLATGDPRKTLLRYLQTSTHNTSKEKIEMANACAIAWNAAAAGRQLLMLKPNAMRTFNLAGTPMGIDYQQELPVPPATGVTKSSLETGIRTNGRGETAPVIAYAGE